MFQESEFPFSGQVYRIGRLNVFEQFHVSRRLAPVLAAMGAEVFKMLKGKGVGGRLQQDDFVAVMTPAADVLSRLSNEDSEYVLTTCLNVVKRKQGEVWSPMMTAQGLMMFQDVDLMIMLRLVVEVVRENLGSFFPTVPAEDSSTDTQDPPGVEIQ